VATLHQEHVLQVQELLVKEILEETQHHHMVDQLMELAEVVELTQLE
tara:strand:+ start:353 stop:493 length:141 start_codon:yes stop_codon:yes gene_type:complete